jgi:uncharacterized membrane protein
MDQHLRAALDRWLAAGLLDQPTVDRLREFESVHAPTHRSRLGAAIAWAFGAILIGAGIVSWVASNWQQMTPPLRMTLILLLTAGFHIAAGFLTHLPQLRLSLHAIGTLGLGAGISLAGQIFNLDAGWNGWMMLWALGASAGYWLLRDWPQMILMALLIPLWLSSEWEQRVASHHAMPYLALWLGLAVLYFTSSRRSLIWVGGIGLGQLTILLMVLSHARVSASPGDSDWLCFLLLTAVFLVFAHLSGDKGRLAAVILASLLTLLVTLAPGWQNYLALGLGHAALTGWGVASQRVERINLGIVGFAMTVIGFCISHAVSLLGSSLGLILMGGLMLGGGFLLERTRRRLLGAIQ